MNQRIISLILCFAMMLSLAACTAPSEGVAETTAAVTDETTAPTTEETTCPTEAVTEPAETTGETVPAEPGVIDPAAPVKAPPEAGDYPEGITEEMVLDYLSTAIFMGDSTTYSMYQWELRNKQLGDALFLVRGGVSINSLLTGYRKYFHSGAEKLASDAVRDAVADQGKERLFIMLGLNDVPQYGVDHSMELLDDFLNQILDKSPQLEIYLESVTMVRTADQYPGLTNEELDEYNSRLKQYAEENESVHYVELAEYFKDHTNGLSVAYSYDKIHANDDGVAVWVRILKKYIAEELYAEAQEAAS